MCLTSNVTEKLQYVICCKLCNIISMVSPRNRLKCTSGSMCLVELPSSEKWLFICSTSSPVVAPASSCHLPPHWTWNSKKASHINIYTGHATMKKLSIWRWLPKESTIHISISQWRTEDEQFCYILRVFWRHLPWILTTNQWFLFHHTVYVCSRDCWNGKVKLNHKVKFNWPPTFSKASS